jgi:hypothetical protein
VRSYMRALGRRAQQEPEVRALVSEVYHLVKPVDDLRAPELIAKVVPLMEPLPLS